MLGLSLQDHIWTTFPLSAWLFLASKHLLGCSAQFMKTTSLDGVEVEVVEVLVHVLVVTNMVVDVVVHVKIVVVEVLDVLVEVCVELLVGVRVLVDEVVVPVWVRDVVVCVRDVVVAACVVVVTACVLAAPLGGGTAARLLAPSSSGGACNDTVALPTSKGPVVTSSMPLTPITWIFTVLVRLSELRRR